MNCLILLRATLYIAVKITPVIFLSNWVQKCITYMLLTHIKG